MNDNDQNKVVPIGPFIEAKPLGPEPTQTELPFLPEMFNRPLTSEEKEMWMRHAMEVWPDGYPDDFTEEDFDAYDNIMTDDGENMVHSPIPVTGEIIVKHAIDSPKPVAVDYKGYWRVQYSDAELADIYSHLNRNAIHPLDYQSPQLLTNEYLILENEAGEVQDIRRWNGEELVEVKPRKISSIALGKCTPKDEVQICAFDSIQENDITVLYGKAGCGKTHIPLNHIMQWLETGKFNKLYVVYSYEPMRNAKTLGYEKGTHTEKVLMSGSIGNILASKLGDLQAVERMIQDNKLEIVPTANIRGMEFSDKSIVLVTEAQNLDTYTMKTIVQRCAEGCKQIYEGDILEQTDVVLANSGMARLIEIFKGHPKFGCIKLHKGYRSPLCELADMM